MTKPHRAPIFLAIVTLVATVVTANAQTATASGPIGRAIQVEAARLVADAGNASKSFLASESEAARLSAWMNLRTLRAGDDIVMTWSRADAARYWFLSVQDSSFTVLDLSSPTIPADVLRELRDKVESDPLRFADVRRGVTFRLPRHVTIGPDGVSHEGRYLFPLSDVVVDVPRAEVAEVRVLRRHVGRHAKRGAIIGAVAFVLLGSATCQSDCGSAGGYALAAAAGGFTGLHWGSIVGRAAPPSRDLVYRR